MPNSACFRQQQVPNFFVKRFAKQGDVEKNFNLFPIGVPSSLTQHCNPTACHAYILKLIDFFQTRNVVSHDTCNYWKIPCDLKNSSPISPFTSRSSASNTSLSPKPSASFFWVQSGFGPVGLGVRRFHHSGNSRASSEL